MKNILVIQGGGRAKGNTAQLIEHFANGVRDSGHTVEMISLLKNEIVQVEAEGFYRAFLLYRPRR